MPYINRRHRRCEPEYRVRGALVLLVEVNPITRRSVRLALHVDRIVLLDHLLLDPYRVDFL